MKGVEGNGNISKMGAVRLQPRLAAPIAEHNTRSGDKKAETGKKYQGDQRDRARDAQGDGSVFREIAEEFEGLSRGIFHFF